MEKEIKQIELRSEKVRNIIGQVPPVLLRYGITIIGVSLLMLIGISAFIPYQSTVDIRITVKQDTSGVLHYTAHIPQSAMDKHTQFLEIVAETASDIALPVRYRIVNISDTVTLSEQEAWHTAAISPKGNISRSIHLENTVTVPATILLKKKSILTWVLGRVFFIS